MKIAVTAA
uniref:Uncharacterized protein n=1 Tax=Arundo donax TaxID=35708 RepID=A0A0A8Y5H1_ARUDO